MLTTGHWKVVLAVAHWRMEWLLWNMFSQAMEEQWPDMTDQDGSGTFQDAKLGSCDGGHPAHANCMLGLSATPWDPGVSGVTVPLFDFLPFDGGDM